MSIILLYRFVFRIKYQGMNKKYLPCALAAKQMDTETLRENFLITDLFKVGKIDMYYTDCDRAVVGTACPTNTALKLDAGDELRAEYFCQRRELCVLNIGASGTVSVDGVNFDLDNAESLYIGRGSKDITFVSKNAENIAEFYFVSYPAHVAYPTVKSAKGEGNMLNLGEQSKCNVRTINQVVCEGKIKSAQLVMGHTHLNDGSVWNTMPVHTHERRSEVYMYYDIQDGECVFHFMGSPQETRHLVVRNKNVVLSPSWSIHSGCGTKAYSFCWGMGGENQRFDDMDPVNMKDLK